MKAKDFDKKFEEGQEDIVDDLDLSSARRVNQEEKRINVDFPAWVVDSLDREAARISGALKRKPESWHRIPIRVKIGRYVNEGFFHESPKN
ncbi:hypothetical protein [uncultured Marinobacter sp.]|uniref:type II toxin-antitoxin system BrnA family antitoxin n=1 Tax=Marinobacter flavimaris TaxID=262076 RepID=UPI0025904B1E|nr:hypothetical protein [uncultured Marinobacter sp.]